MKTIISRPARHHHHQLLWHPYELTLATLSLSIIGSLLIAALLQTDRVAYSPCAVQVTNGFCSAAQ